ncbi:MAG: outer membrane lipoprotein LolB [Betaproteobacteria bacterium]|nr:outer membrane lipoprotein LolB [Betaproteobacteria bacterium]
MLRACALLAAALALGACAGLTELPAERRSLVEFELAGRIAVRYGREAASGNIAWRHADDADELLITTPVGGAVARIVRGPDAVMVTGADGVEHRAADAQSLTERVLGFRLPLEGLADWVRARPSISSVAAAHYDLAGKLTLLEQDGWRIEYLEHESSRSGAMPTRMRLHYPGLELRLAIHEWKRP